MKRLNTQLLEAASDWVLDSKSTLVKLITAEVHSICPPGRNFDLAEFLIDREDGDITVEEQIYDSSIPVSFAVTRKYQHHITCYMDTLYVEIRNREITHDVVIEIKLVGMYDDLGEIMEVRPLQNFDLEELAQLAAHLAAHRDKFTINDN